MSALDEVQQAVAGVAERTGPAVVGSAPAIARRGSVGSIATASNTAPTRQERTAEG